MNVAKTTLALLALTALALSSVAALAQPKYPDKPVHIVVPYSPGGGADMLARAIGQQLGTNWGQPVVVENKAGAGGSIGTGSVARSEPDGYTMLMASPSHSINASLYKNLAFDTARDFSGVTIVASGPLVLVVNPSLPVKSLSDLVEMAKSLPGKLTFASAGIGSSPHLAGELLRMMAGIDITHVPYKGTAPALSDLLGGQVQMFFAPVPTILGHLRNGKLRALGVTTPRRFPALPDVPSIAESGLNNYEVIQWWGLVVPAGTPKEVLAEQYAQTKRVLDSAEMKERLAAMGAAPGGNSPEEFDAFLRAEIIKWAKVIEEAKVTPN